MQNGLWLSYGIILIQITPVFGKVTWGTVLPPLFSVLGVALIAYIAIRCCLKAREKKAVEEYENDPFIYEYDRRNRALFSSPAHPRGDFGPSKHFRSSLTHVNETNQNGSTNQQRDTEGVEFSAPNPRLSHSESDVSLMNQFNVSTNYSEALSGPNRFGKKPKKSVVHEIEFVPTSRRTVSMAPGMMRQNRIRRHFQAASSLKSETVQVHSPIREEPNKEITPPPPYNQAVEELDA